MPGVRVDSKDTILEAALGLFAARGYDAVGVQEIVEAVGLTKPTLYHYFGSKRGLLDAILSRYGEGLCESLAAAAVYRGDLTGTLEDLAFAFARFARDNADFYRLQLALYFAPAQSEANIAALQWNERIYRIVEDMFKKAAGQHGNMRGRHAAYAASFIGTVNTYIGLGQNGYLKLSDQALRAAVKQFMHGIFS